MIAPGFHENIASATYHADDLLDVPTLSSSIAKILVSDEAPIKAFMAHPRLGGSVGKDEPTRAKEIGTAAHKMILGRGGDVVLIEADDYKTGKAREQRVEAYARGACPILMPDADKAERMASAVRVKISAEPDCEGFLSAQPEVVGLVQDRTGAWLRVMIDKLELHERHAVIWDVKTGDQSAAPQGLGRRIGALGMDVQAAFYERVVQQIRPDLAGRIAFRWLFVENDAPHLFVPAELDGCGREIGRRKVSYAIAIWNRCISRGDWPGYPTGIVRAEYPPWEENRWLQREIALADQGIDGLADVPPVPSKRDSAIDYLAAG